MIQPAQDLQRQRGAPDHVQPQTTTGAQHGMNTIVIRDVARGDVITCQNCAFAKQPAITYGTDAGAVEWTFNAGSISFLLGM